MKMKSHDHTNTQKEPMPSHHRATEQEQPWIDIVNDKVIPQRHVGRWIAGVVVAFSGFLLIKSLLTNPSLEVGIIGEYLFQPYIIKGVGMTLVLTIVSWTLGTLLAIALAVMRLSKNPVLASISWAYTWFFRGTPTLVQIIFWGFLGSLYPKIVLKIPFVDWTLVDVPTASVLSATVAAIVALTLNEAAYNAEIVRGGILSVDRGQNEASTALGLTAWQSMKTIVLPQSMRAIIPPMGNQFIALLKMTSLVSVVGGKELLTAAQNVYSQTFKTIPLLAVAALWYLALVSVLSIGQYFLEKKFGKGA